MLDKIIPKQASNDYSGPFVPLIVFYLITIVSFIRSLIHIFAPDGGAGSIATIPIEVYLNGAKEAVIFLFSIWGLSQLLLALVYALVCIRYKNLLPLMYLMLFFEYFGRVLIGNIKPLTTIQTAPGEIGNYVLIPLSLGMFLWIIVANKKKIT